MRNPVNYDITINSERLGIENSIKLIKEALSIKFPGVVS